MSVRKRAWTNGQGVEKEAWVVGYVDQNGTRRLKTFPRTYQRFYYRSRTAINVSPNQ